MGLPAHLHAATNLRLSAHVEMTVIAGASPRPRRRFFDLLRAF
jgi:hypothetical protein